MKYNDIEINDSNIYALVDCNQFFVSCERVFAPHLEGMAVGVLSNNDGCLVALSPELKALGVVRGTPGFKIRETIGNQKIYLFSSNYELYADMSSRVMTILSSMADEIEVYSVDEAFLLFKNLHSNFDLYNYAQEIKARVRRETGIPISIGLARTKTLAKIANKVAKKSMSGICELLRQDIIDETLPKIFVGDIWGIGRQHLKRLTKYGIYSAEDLLNYSVQKVRKEMSVTGERTLLELKGVPCIGIEEAPTTKSLVHSRSFGKPISNFKDLLESITSYTTRAIAKLRRKNLVAKNLTIFITTNPFKDTKQYANFATGVLFDYSAYTPDFINLSTELLKKIYKEGYSYKKSGVMLTDIIKLDKIQPTLFTNSSINLCHQSCMENITSISHPPSSIREFSCNTYGDDKRHKVMEALDNINNKYGKEKVFYASNGIQKNWDMKREMVSPRYTSRWKELMVVR